MAVAQLDNFLQRLRNERSAETNDGSPAASAPPPPDGPGFDTAPTAIQWQIFSLGDAYAPRPPLEFVVKDVITRGSLVIVYGAPGAYKSFLLADLCACVAGGRPWLTGTPGNPAAGFAVAPGPTLWIDIDNGCRRTHERFAAIGRAYGLPADAPLYYITMPDPPFNAADRSSLGALAVHAMALDARLVVIDNLGLIVGGMDENSADMASVMAGLRWLAEYTGATVIVVHHQRKAGPMGKGAREGETLRGHSSIEASLDLALLVKREEGGSGVGVVIKATKERDVEVKPFGALFAWERGAGGQGLASARFFGAPIISAADKALDLLRARILGALAGGELNWSGLRGELGGRADTLRLALEDLVKAGQVARRAGGHGATIYSLLSGTGQEVQD